MEEFDVALYFDTESTKRIKSFTANFTNDKINFHADRPHITLGILNSDENFVRQRVEAISTSDFSISVTFPTFGFFPGPNQSVALFATPTESLLKLHRKVVLEANSLTVSKYYQPNSWMPHCTLISDTSAGSFALNDLNSIKEIIPLYAKIESIVIIRWTPLPTKLWERSSQG